MAEQSVVIQHDLAVYRQESLVTGDHQRVDLCQGGVALDKDTIKGTANGGELADDDTWQAEVKCQVANLVVHQSQHGVNHQLEDLFRGVFGHLFDLDTTLGGDDHSWLAVGPIEGDAYVDFFANVGSLINEHFAHGDALDGHS